MVNAVTRSLSIWGLDTCCLHRRAICCLIAAALTGRRTVYDAVNDRNIVLSDAEVTILNRIRKGQFPDPTFDAFPEFDDLFTSEKRIEALGKLVLYSA